MKKDTVPSPLTVLYSHPSVPGSLHTVALVARQELFADNIIASSPVPVPTLKNVALSPVAREPEMSVNPGGT
jgi:hypothetical protein